MNKSKIEWCDTVWNPVTGCTRVSAGCDNCYAARMTKRLEGMGQEKYRGLINQDKKHFNGVVKVHPEELYKPLHWKPSVIFVNSMSDLFHENLPFHRIEEVFYAMWLCPLSQFIILTKRPERAIKFFEEEQITPSKNVWIGVSVEDQATADERIPKLLEIPAAHLLLSMEPLIGPIKLKKHWLRLGIHWIIAGGESGPSTQRPLHPDWVRSIRDQCQAANIPFFFKQWGEYVPLEFDAQPPFRFFSNIPTSLFDGHYIDVVDPDTNEPGKFLVYGFMEPMQAITICAETNSKSCDFLRVGKKTAGCRLDGKHHLDNPAREILRNEQHH